MGVDLNGWGVSETHCKNLKSQTLKMAKGEPQTAPTTEALIIIIVFVCLFFFWGGVTKGNDILFVLVPTPILVSMSGPPSVT